MKYVYLTAKWCAPCKAYGPIVKEVCAAEGIELETLDVDSDPARVAKFNVRGVPTLVVTDNGGRPVSSLTGARSKSELQRFIQSIGN